MNLYKKDLSSIGHTAWPQGEELVIIISGATVNIELILLREILVLTGHSILAEEDYDETDVCVVTDYPWADYSKLNKGD